jgi:hypothetical protein
MRLAHPVEALPPQQEGTPVSQKALAVVLLATRIYPDNP